MWYARARHAIKVCWLAPPASAMLRTPPPTARPLPYATHQWHSVGCCLRPCRMLSGCPSPPPWPCARLQRDHHPRELPVGCGLLHRRPPHAGVRLCRVSSSGAGHGVQGGSGRHWVPRQWGRRASTAFGLTLGAWQPLQQSWSVAAQQAGMTGWWSRPGRHTKHPAR